MTSLASRLGYSANDSMLIISATGLGTCHATNVAVYDTLRNGVASSASLRVPCPWAREAAASHRGDDIGVALTLTAEFELYQWGPITHAPSLLGGDGGFPRTAADVWDHADPDEVRRECRAQVERAILWGFDVTHLSSHDDVMVSRPELFDILVELSSEFSLPVRLGDNQARERIGFPIEELARDEGLVFPDRVLPPAPGQTRSELLASYIADPFPGLTEIQLQPGIDVPELRAITAEWPHRVDDHAALGADGPIARALGASDIRQVGYRDLRAALRD